MQATPNIDDVKLEKKFTPNFQIHKTILEPKYSNVS